MSRTTNEINNDVKNYCIKEMEKGMGKIDTIKKESTHPCADFREGIGQILGTIKGYYESRGILVNLFRKNWFTGITEISVYIERLLKCKDSMSFFITMDKIFGNFKKDNTSKILSSLNFNKRKIIQKFKYALQMKIITEATLSNKLPPNTLVTFEAELGDYINSKKENSFIGVMTSSCTLNKDTPEIVRNYLKKDSAGLRKYLDEDIKWYKAEIRDYIEESLSEIKKIKSKQQTNIKH